MSLVLRALARPPMLAETALTLEPGSVAALVGPNGSGKTTLLTAIAGLTAGAGSATLSGRPLAPSSFAWLPANREAPFPVAAADIVALGLPRPDPAAVATALARTDTAHLAGRPLTRLSTGERARILVARALVRPAPLLLLDEPTANLDPAHALLVAALLREEAARGATVLYATHDIALARTNADRLLVLECGRIVADGSPAQALSPETLAQVFHVRDLPPGFARL